MKKSLILTIALMLALSISCTVFAAANPFVDVPAKHWAYDAVAQLAQAGILEGYGDGSYKGGNLATRYEMAQATAKAMSRSDKATTVNKALIDKLTVEFAAELNNFGVRVAKLEKNASNIKFSGDTRIRYQSNSNLALLSNSSCIYSNWDTRVRINATAEVNDILTFNGRLLGWSNTNPSVNAGGNWQGQVRFEIANFSWQFNPNNSLTIGRQAMTLGQGLMSDWTGDFDAFRYDFSSGKIKGFVAYGDISRASAPYAGEQLYTAFPPITYPPSYAGAIHLSYDVAKDWAVTAATLWSFSNDTATLDPSAGSYTSFPFQNYGFGFAGKLAPDWTLSGEYIVNTSKIVSASYTGDNSTAWFAKIMYKGADAGQPGSWGAYIDYRDVKPYAVDSNMTTLLVDHLADGIKGFGIGFNWTIAKNTILYADYFALKQNRNTQGIGSGSGSDPYAPYYHVEVNLSF